MPSPYPLADEIRIVQDGARDTSTTEGQLRADESGGWVWEASKALSTECAELEGLHVLELGAGTGWLALQLARRGAIVTATDREGALPRILRNVLRNQQRTGCSADGEEPLLRVTCCALDWEEAIDTPARGEAGASEGCSGATGGPWDLIVGGDLIYNHEIHAPLLATIARHCSSSPPAGTLAATRVLLSWEERKPAEEANFLAMAQAAGFRCTLVHATTSSVNGAPITVHALELVSCTCAGTVYARSVTQMHL